MTLKPVEVAKILRCSKARVYDIIRLPDFPKVVDGRRVFIPRDGFFRWLDNAADGQRSKF